MRWARAIAVCLLFAAAPAAAQSTDPFQSAPVATPAPKPRPQPRYNEPDVTSPPAAAAPAPPPAASLPPPGASWARVRQAAQADGIGVPLASDPPFDASGASPQARMLVGAWGPGTWQGSAGGEKLILIVLGVDGGSNVRGVVARSAGINWAYYTAPLAVNRFTVHITTSYEASGRVPSTRTMEDENWQFDLRPDGTLAGSRNGSTIALARLQ